MGEHLSSDTILNKVENYLQYQKERGDKFVLKPSAPTPKKEKEIIINSITKPEIIENTASQLGDWKNASSLPELKLAISNCKECPLGNQRTKFVFGEGNPNADIMIIGEAPGRDEDLQGMPFVGRAGQLLTKILESIGLNREDVFIGNICKCRPPENRQPETGEVEKCEPYLKKQIELINPAFILSLGLTSINTLLKTKNKMADIRGQVLDYHGKKLLVTYHPAALLRNPNWKRFVWEDMKNLKSLYDEHLKNKDK
jgi:uracil-DNA glycosylase